MAAAYHRAGDAPVPNQGNKVPPPDRSWGTAAAGPDPRRTVSSSPLDSARPHDPHARNPVRRAFAGCFRSCALLSSWEGPWRTQPQCRGALERLQKDRPGFVFLGKGRGLGLSARATKARYPSESGRMTPGRRAVAAAVARVGRPFLSGSDFPANACCNDAQ